MGAKDEATEATPNGGGASKRLHCKVSELPRLVEHPIRILWPQMNAEF